MPRIFYERVGWSLALVMTAWGIARIALRRDLRPLPLFLIAGMVIAVGAGMHGGLGILGEYHGSRYMTGFCITAVGLAIWSVAYAFTKDNA